MNIVFLTNKTTHGVSILDELQVQNIKIKGIIIDEHFVVTSRVAKVKKLVLKLFPVILLNLIREVANKPIVEGYFLNKFYNKYSDFVKPVGNLNSIEAETLLRCLEPDLIVLGGSRILRENILKIPTYGVVNVHPGILPKYRGVDVIRWAIYNKDKVGVTVHFVDSGVDTGRIIKSEIIDVQIGETIEDIKIKAINLGAKLMGNTVKLYLENKFLETIDNPISSGSQYYKMEANKALTVDQNLAAI